MKNSFHLVIKNLTEVVTWDLLMKQQKKEEQ